MIVFIYFNTTLDDDCRCVEAKFHTTCVCYMQDNCRVWTLRIHFVCWQSVSALAAAVCIPWWRCSVANDWLTGDHPVRCHCENPRTGRRNWNPVSRRASVAVVRIAVSSSHCACQLRCDCSQWTASIGSSRTLSGCVCVYILCHNLDCWKLALYIRILNHVFLSASWLMLHRCLFIGIFGSWVTVLQL